MVGTGRIIGDGGTVYQVVDIAVDPEYQGKALVKQIMAELKCHIDSEIPDEAYVSLIADGQAKCLYCQFDFEETMPESEVMYYKRT
ncbi:GNAT family N-acetyltransferase [Enterococcus sp. CWB-B31]|uniref:GNAT family N-acetyltransferase n=1 Tax=Enterococcus sp. CWB-B31 TaxID=2885159 RepID=UPI00226CBF38|nr:GNAT family N-acetyltransferase [Enterococcus sp. CWB-B31]MCB5954526.1 GNAT family N-acetyltransferase [Enterococcus sp. CWB-B31]